MKILIKQAKVIDPSSPFNGQITDIITENGIITAIGSSSGFQADKTIDIPGLHVSPGWIDLFANFADPGYEFKETLETGIAAAAAGGFTDVLLTPNTNPAVHNKAAVEYIVHKSATAPVRLHPIGAVTRNTEGKELAEMYDMRASGAVAFSDGTNSIQSAGLLLKALQYVKAFDGVVIQLPDDKTINPQGLMNEGIVSTRLGLPGKPAMAEELIVARDIKLARYAESKIHFTGISTAKSLSYVQRGRESGTSVTCSITPYHLFFTDEDLHSYDTNLKLNPPLRSAADRTALQEAVRSGAIDCIASHHFPHEYDSKVLEFEYARNGMISLETAFAVVNTAVPGVSPERWVELMSINPRVITGLPVPSITINQPATLTLFDPSEKWTVAASDFRSKSRNTPFFGRELIGRVKGIINRGQVILN